MALLNKTTVQEFILLGLESGEQKRFLLFIFFTIIYIITLLENFTIIVLVHLDGHLAQLPMYILLSNFSWLEICYVTSTVPRMLYDLTFPQGIISFHACFWQFYIFFSLGSTECCFFSAMALDRYLAICHPLHYPNLMSTKNCSRLVAGCWIVGFLGYAGPVTLISRLSFCESNLIDNFVCDQGLMSLACPPLNNASFITQISMNVLIILGNFVFVVISYSTIVLTLVKVSNPQSRRKAFSTISFHLMAVTLFYGSVVAMYVTPSGEGQSRFTKIVTVFYTVMTPFLNPMIYCLRNNQVKEALGRVQRSTEQWLREKMVL